MITTNKIPFPDKNTYEKLLLKSNFHTFFQTYDWLSLWIKHFGKDSEVWEVYDDNNLIGIVSLLKESDTYSLIPTAPVLNGQQVSDYGELIIEKGREREVIKRLSGIRDQEAGKKIILNFIREESPSLSIFRELNASIENQDVAPFLTLPKTFEEYVTSLKRHERHELRRKIRRFDASGASFKWFNGDKALIDRFFELMVFDEKKKKFLTDSMKLFFKEIINEFYKKGEGTILFIKSEEKLVAAILLFYFQDEVLLYNSGFNPSYFHLSPGLIVVAQAIRDSIEKGKKIFDFLRGNERYKYDLGGKDRKLFKITI